MTIDVSTSTAAESEGGASSGSSSPAELEARLRSVIAERYHDRHPFNLRMAAGGLDRAEVRRWIRNRYEYQRALPIKDALIVASLPEAADRRLWLQRIVDQDGSAPGDGGIAAWERLAAAAGIEPAALADPATVLPGVRFAVEAYVEFCRHGPWLEAVAASLTELAAPDLMSRRVEVFERHYPWIEPSGLDYFRRRVTQGRRDASHGLALVLAHARSPEQQRAVVDALRFKCDVLWALLDAVDCGPAAGAAQAEAAAAEAPA